MSEWKTAQGKSAAKTISSQFGGEVPAEETTTPEDTDTLLQKIKKWYDFNFKSSGLGAKTSEEMKKNISNQLTPPKK